MSTQLEAPGMSHIEALDRVLDKGIVIDAWVHVSLVGIGLVTVQARIVVASIRTYLEYSDALAHAALSTPAATPPAPAASMHDKASKMDGLPLPLVWSFS